MENQFRCSCEVKRNRINPGSMSDWSVFREIFPLKSLLWKEHWFIRMNLWDCRGKSTTKLFLCILHRNFVSLLHTLSTHHCFHPCLPLVLVSPKCIPVQFSTSLIALDSFAFHPLPSQGALPPLLPHPLELTCHYVSDVSLAWREASWRALLQLLPRPWQVLHLAHISI